MATFAQVRERVLEFTGRLDLDSNDADGTKKVHFFINEAQKRLDGKYPVSKDHLVRFASIAVGDNTFTVRYMRRVDALWFSQDEDGKRWQLGEVSAVRLRTEFPHVDSSTDPLTTAPSCFAIVASGLAPEQKAVTDLSSYLDTGGIITGDHWNYDTIMFAPAADSAYTARLEGLFYLSPLSADDDVSYWTINRPNLLINQTCALIEHAYKNTSGYNDWMQGVKDEGRDLDSDIVRREEAIAGLVMRG